MFCPNCAKQINDGDSFCAFCGAVLSPIGAPPADIQPIPDTVPAQRKRPGLLPLIVPIASCVLVTGAAAVYLAGSLLLGGFSGRHGNGGKDNNSSIIPAKENATSSQATETSASEMSVPTTVAAETSSIAETSELPTEPKTSATEPDDSGANADVSYSTDEHPSFEDFSWCEGQNGFVIDVPEGAEPVSDPLGYSGGWKAMIVYNSASSSGTFARELNNVYISVSDDTVVLTIDWYLMMIDGSEPYSEEDMEDSVFTGFVTDTGIYASGDAEISVNSLWKADGKEYALGTLITSDGTPAYLALVRP